MSKKRSGFDPFAVMIAHSPALWHVHSDARGVIALTTSTKAPTREGTLESYLIPLQYRLWHAGVWVQVDYCWTREEAARKVDAYYNPEQNKAVA